jgi:hypothetical protein
MINVRVRVPVGGDVINLRVEDLKMGLLEASLSVRY